MITITSNNIYKTDFSIADLKSVQNLDIIPEDEVLSYLSDYVEFGESVTFERIFEIISLNRNLIQKIFHSCLGGYSLNPFIKEIEDIPSHKSELKYLEIAWACDKYDDDFNISPSFHGIGLHKNDENSEEEETSYAIEFTPLNNLKHHQIRLNTFLSYMVIPKRDEPKNDDSRFVDLGNKYFTLFDIIYAVLFEITFNGDPKNRDSRLAELEDTAQELRDKEDLILKDDIDIEHMFDDEYTVRYGDYIDSVDKDLLENKSNLEKIKNCFIEKFKVWEDIENSEEKDLTIFDKKLTDIEFNIQTLYGIDEDINYHRFWEIPKCTCPKIDNSLKFPKGDYDYDEECPIHKNRKTKL